MPGEGAGFRPLRFLASLMKILERTKSGFRFAAISAAVVLGLSSVQPVDAYCVGGVETDAALPRHAITVAGAIGGRSPTYVQPTAEGVSIAEALEQAGGLSRDAYPLGALLFRRLPEMATAPRGSQSYVDLSAGALEALQIVISGPASGTARDALVDVLRRDRGFARLPVAVDMPTRRRFPDRDLLLRQGDVLFIPQRPGLVAVIGAVKSPGAVAFSTGDLADDYLARAGGLLEGASQEAAGVYLPSGELRELAISPWKYQPQNVPPGSVIVVPYRNESLQRYARDVRARLTLNRLTAADDQDGDAEGAAALLPPLAEATTSCPAP